MEFFWIRKSWTVLVESYDVQADHGIDLLNKGNRCKPRTHINQADHEMEFPTNETDNIKTIYCNHDMADHNLK